MLPLPYILFGMLIALAASFGAGWHYGGKQVKADWNAERVHIAQQSEQERTRIGAEDKKADVRAAKRNEQRQTTQQAVTQALIDHVQTLPDPSDCRLDVARVRNINAAFGVSADSGSQTATVPQTRPAPERQP